MSDVPQSWALELKPEAGTYALILHCRIIENVPVGRWGVLPLKPGYFVYVGSAQGPGGIRARVLRHCRKAKPRHWHIDYLTTRIGALGAWYHYGQNNLEHEWACILGQMPTTDPIKGFGCSDCNCFSHLFWNSEIPDRSCFMKAAGGRIEAWWTGR